MTVTTLTHQQVDELIPALALQIKEFWDREGGIVGIYPVPRGGVPVAYALIPVLKAMGIPTYICNLPQMSQIAVDDLIDSGATRDALMEKFRIPTFALIDKQKDNRNDWIVFPWEVTEEKSADDIVIRLLQYIGEDVKRGGLMETPKRVLKAWKHWTAGYNVDISSLFKVFEDGANDYNEMIVVKNIPFYSHCEHHLAPFFGIATVGYIPGEKGIVGLSKLSRLVSAYSQRLQVQERLTVQIADAINLYLQPKGVGVFISARHLCMESRGICQQGHTTETTALRGAFINQETRSEFIARLS